jgi:endonuclease-3
VIDNPMATTINKQRLLNQVFATAKKGNEVTTGARPVLEEFLYGLCRENATAAQADRAFRILTERFFDWNEVRVSSTRELEEAFSGMSSPDIRAQRLVAFLQEVFETTFSFTLEDLHKKGLKQAAKQLSRYQASNDYSGAWVTQRSLGGHAIPIDPPTLRCARRLGLIDETQDDNEARTTLEHLIPKAKGPAFTDLISNLAEDLCWEDEPNCQACPLASECSFAQENGVEAMAASRTHRPKPR